MPIGRELALPIACSLCRAVRWRCSTNSTRLIIAHDYVLKANRLLCAEASLNTATEGVANRALGTRLMSALGNQVVNFDALHKSDPQHASPSFIHNEHPQTISLVSSPLKPTHAAALACSAARRDAAPICALRISNLREHISPESIAKIATLIDIISWRSCDFIRESYGGGARHLSEMLLASIRIRSGDLERSPCDQLPTLWKRSSIVFVFEDLI